VELGAAQLRATLASKHRSRPCAPTRPRIHSSSGMGMSDRFSHRVTHRYVESSTRVARVVHIDPLGYRWGWFSDDIQRLHLVPCDVEFQKTSRVWLEDLYGRRAFEIDQHPPSGSLLDLDQLRESVARSRDAIEAAWLRTCEAKGWLMYSPRDAMISLHSGTPHELVRRLKAIAFVPELLQIDTQTNAACLEARLNRIIWTGSDDGSDAAPARSRATR